MRSDRMNSSRAEEVNTWAKTRTSHSAFGMAVLSMMEERVISSRDAHTTQTDTCCGMSEYSADQPPSAKPPTNGNLSSDRTSKRERSVTSHIAKASVSFCSCLAEIPLRFYSVFNIQRKCRREDHNHLHKWSEQDWESQRKGGKETTVNVNVNLLQFVWFSSRFRWAYRQVLHHLVNTVEF